MTVGEPGSQKWSDYAFGLALACLLGMALAHVFGLATLAVNTVFVAGVLISGTAAWVIQARLVCPHCGSRYGYGIRILNSHLCPKCKGDMRVE